MRCISSVLKHVLVLGFLLSACTACALQRHTPDLPNPKTAIHYQLGTVGLLASEAYPVIQHHTPPKGFFEGSLRGFTHGAVVGFDVGKAVGNLIWQGAVKNAQHCHGKHCGNVTLLMGAMSLATLIVTPTAFTTLGGLTGGILADSSSKVMAWQQSLDQAQAQLKMQRPCKHIFFGLLTDETIPSCLQSYYQT